MTQRQQQPCFAWERDMDHHGFISNIEDHRASGNPEGLRLAIDDPFLDAVDAMDDEDYETVLRSLQKAWITTVSLFNVSSGGAQDFNIVFRSRLIRLFVVLGQSPALTTVWCFCDETGVLDALLPALKLLRNASTVDIYGLFRTEARHAAKLAHALKGHPSLEELGLFVPPRFYRSLLPILRTIPTLRKVVLQPLSELPSARGFRADADRRAVAELMASEAPLELDLAGEAHEWLCQVLPCTCIRGLCLRTPIRSESAASIFTALGRSRLTLLRLHHHHHPIGTYNCPDTTPMLVKCILTMPLLEELEITFQSGQEEVPVAILRAAVRSLRLKRLHFRLTDHSCFMDKALARCVAANTSLDSITIAYIPFKSQSGLHLPSTLRLSAALDAVRSSFSTCQIVVENSSDPETNDFVRNVATVTRLNRAGRAYVKCTPGDQVKGCRVLENVKDDLDCLYFHLRENPTLCGTYSEP